MKREDLVVGEKYVVTQCEGDIIDPYLAVGDIVELVHIPIEREVLVQDLSENKNGDGRWHISPDKLAPYPATYSEHYDTAHQPIEVMQANMTHDEFVGFLKGNIIKYACRCGRKDDPKKEAAKIYRYAGWLVDVLEGKTIDPRR